jgi:methionyl-tRNA formyltransferase
MDQENVVSKPDRWRVVVFTNIPGGMVYALVDETLRPLGHRIVGVVTTPGPKQRRSLAYLDVVAAVRPGVDVLVSNHPERWAAMLAPLRPDLIISGGMPWRIPPDVLALPRLGAINLHPALLPRYRGPAAIEWAFRNGDAEMGVTVHRLSPDFDTGPILAQARIPITDEDDIDSLMSRFGPVLPGLLEQALERVALGDPGEPQDEAEATYASLFDDEWRIIDWGRPARAIHNQVRSWSGIRDVGKGALGEVDGELLLITRTRLRPAEPGVEGAPPGTIVCRDGEELVVQCGDGAISLVSWSRVESDPGTAQSAQG